MSFDPMDIIFSLIAGLVGFFYLIYGKREQNFPFMVCGLGLMTYTLATSSTSQIIWAGLLLIILPFILDKLL